jgi:hypothetical protein
MPTKRKSTATVPSTSLVTTSGHASQASNLRGTDPILPLPSSVRVFGKDVTIEYATIETSDEENISGDMSEEKLAIRVRPGQLPIEEMDTVLHETIHAVDYILDLGLTEHQVRMLGTGLVGLFQDNPGFAAFVTRSIPRR